MHDGVKTAPSNLNLDTTRRSVNIITLRPV